MKILVTGGCGYTGTILVNKLLDLKHRVNVIDTQWFGNHLKKHKNLRVFREDIRNFNIKMMKDIDVIYHLANIANDPSVELNPSLSWEVNVLATKRLIETAIKYKVKQFIFASSGSVYGVKKEKKVTEELNCVPISIYNKTKMIAERVLKSYSNDIKIHCIRPATVCGFSPRMRLDVSVNMFVHQALTRGEMIIFGGKQVRPNIHINDLVDVYIHFLNNKKIQPGCYNAGFENLKILDIAKMVQKYIPSKITIKKKNTDPRSYRQDSSKLLKTGFKQKYRVIDAINDIKQRYKKKSILIDEKCSTVKWMKKLGLANG